MTNYPWKYWLYRRNSSLFSSVLYINLDPSVCGSRRCSGCIDSYHNNNSAKLVCTGDVDTEMCCMCTGCWIQTKYSSLIPWSLVSTANPYAYAYFIEIELPPPPTESVPEVKIRQEVSEGWALSTLDTTYPRFNETENIFKNSWILSALFLHFLCCLAKRGRLFFSLYLVSHSLMWASIFLFHQRSLNSDWKMFLLVVNQCWSKVLQAAIWGVGGADFKSCWFSISSQRVSGVFCAGRKELKKN